MQARTLRLTETSNGFPLSSSSWNREELAAIQKVLETGRTTMGENVRQFELEFARRFDVKYAVMVSSGSSANLIATAALCYKRNGALKPGDEVIVPAVSWATTYYPLHQYGLKLKFVDIDLETLNLDVAQLEKALTPKTRMVVAVSILGNPANLTVIRQFCDKHGLYMLEDNCESMGATLQGKQCGTFGDLGTFSTFFSHHISTMEGGIIVTNDGELYELCLSLRAHGWTRDLPSDSQIYEPSGNDFFEAYRFILPGYNARPLEISGALGRVQLQKMDRMIECRRDNANVFTELFKGDDRFIIQKENGKSSWFSFTIILNPNLKIDRAKVLSQLKQAGIEYRIITGGNILRHDVIKYFNYDCVGKMTNADIAHDRGFFVGNAPKSLENEIQLLHDVLDKIDRRSL